MNLTERINSGDTLLFNAADVAAFLRISKRYAYLLMTNGTIPSVRIGRSVRVFATDLLAYVENLQRNAQSQDQ